MKYLLAFAFALAASIPLHAEVLTWQDIMTETITANPALKLSAYALTNAGYNKTKSYSNFLPSLSASAQTSASDTSVEGNTESSAGLTGSLSLFSGFSDVSGVRIARLDLENATLMDKRTFADTIFAIEQSYLEMLWAQETVELSEQIVKRRDENLNLIQLKYEAGREDKGSLLRIEADLERARYDLGKAKRYVTTTSETLQRVMGRDTIKTITLKGELDLPAIPEYASFENLLTHTPEYIISKNNAAKAKFETVLAESSLYPGLSLAANTSAAQSNAHWSTSLNISYPFFPGSKNIYNIRIAKVNEKIAGESLRETILELSASLTKTYNGLIDAVENVKVTEKYLNAAQEQSKITTQKYINGMTTYQDWYSIENDYINTRKSYLDAKKTALKSYATWENLLGR